MDQKYIFLLQTFTPNFISYTQLKNIFNIILL